MLYVCVCVGACVCVCVSKQLETQSDKSSLEKIQTQIIKPETLEIFSQVHHMYIQNIFIYVYVYIYMHMYVYIYSKSDCTS